MKYRLLVLVLAIFTSCAKEEILEDVCITGGCEASWVVDSMNQPDVYKDELNYWHVNPERKYFTVKGELSEIYDDYIVNDIPLVETKFDTNKWFWINAIQFTIPLYNPFGQFGDPQFNRPLPIGNQILKICNMVSHGIVSNLAGYAYHEKGCNSCPYSERTMGSYSSNTLTPKQSFHVDRSMRGDTIEVYMKTKFNYDLGESEEVYRSLRIIVD